ncbi:MAG: CDP-glycerol glycerophosphotransferase family protein [Canibacter sp.]
MKKFRLTRLVGRLSVLRERRAQLSRIARKAVSEAASVNFSETAFSLTQRFSSALPTAIFFVIDGRVYGKAPIHPVKSKPSTPAATVQVELDSIKQIYLRALAEYPDGNQATALQETQVEHQSESPQLTFQLVWAFDPDSEAALGDQIYGFASQNGSITREKVTPTEDSAQGFGTGGYDVLVKAGLAKTVEVSNNFQSLDELGFVEIRGNRNGDFILVAGEPEKTRVTTFADSVEVLGNRLVVYGRMTVLMGQIDSAEVVWKSNTTGIVFEGKSELVLDEAWTRSDAGRRTYSFSSSVEINSPESAELLTSDFYDAYVRVHDNRLDEWHDFRVTRVPFLARLFHTSGVTRSSNGYLSIVPYFTFNVRALSARVEHYTEHVESLLKPTRTYVREVRRKFISRNAVWLIGELPYKAQDNGMHFYNWVREHHPEINAYYVLSADSNERKNLIDQENVVNHGSRRHFELALAAEKFIGTHSPDYLYPTRNPSYVKHLRGKRIFLQHGVMGTKWMVPLYGKKAPGFSIDRVLVSSKFEKSYLVSDFGYDPRDVKVTGLSRFDTLFDPRKEDPQRTLLFMPTWRDWLGGVKDFSTTEYFRNWHGLIASPGLKSLIEQENLSVVLCLHPNMQRFSSLFEGPNVRVVYQGEENVQSLLKHSLCLITDYSSVGFDFSFQSRPVIYFQFDRDQFLKTGSHIDPDADLPGVIRFAQSGVLQALEQLAKSDFQQSKSMNNRAKKFLQYRDTNNSQRVFDAVRATKGSSRHYVRHGVAETGSVVFKRFRRSAAYFPTMRMLYKVGSKLPRIRDLVVFESHLGLQYSDSPRYIYEELRRRSPESPKVWVLNTTQKINDPSVRIVKRLSPAYYWQLSRAEAWVFNQSAPSDLKRPRGVKFVQTWHGTPLKKMQHDAIQSAGRSEGYLERAKRATSQWSVLLSPSSFATKAFRSAFQYTGEVRELGYPRNDILTKQNVRENVEVLKERMSILKTRKVILYAPTFRDDQFTTPGKFKFDLPFDLTNFVRQLPADALLLLRLHSQVAKRLTIPIELQGRVRDVSKYPEMQELLLVSDVLITDYSSVFFDAAVLRKPIIFYAYDLTHYRDSLRGFYLDYEAVVPGPVVKTEEELWKAVSVSLDGTIDEEKRDRFIEEFNPRDDGNASARVVEELLMIGRDPETS